MQLASSIVVIAKHWLAQSCRAGIVFDGLRRTVIDGPFAEARELVAGLSIWEVKDKLATPREGERGKLGVA